MYLDTPLLILYTAALFAVPVLITVLRWTVFPARKPLVGLNCLITGGAGEMGQVMTARLVSKGVTVIVWDNNKERIEQMKEDLNSDRVHYFEVDISSSEAVDKAGDMVLERFQHLDILVNNAVLANPYDLEESSYEELTQALTVNLISHLWTIKKFLPSLRASRPFNGLSGTIVGMSSILGSVGTGGLQTYCTSKAGIIGLMESLYMQHPDLHWCTITPFLINTALFRGMRHKFMDYIYPILDKHYVVDKIVSAMETQQTSLSLPWAWNYAFVVIKNVLPLSVMKVVQDFFGVPVAFKLIQRRGESTLSLPSPQESPLSLPPPQEVAFQSESTHDSTSPTG